MEGADIEAKISWTRHGRRSLAELTKYLKTHDYGDPVARADEISDAIYRLRHAPALYPIAFTSAGMDFRCAVVSGRFLVYYVYFPARSADSEGRVSIRGVKHGAQRNPFSGVREPAHLIPLWLTRQFAP
jgi:hypothetical protein